MKILIISDRFQEPSREEGIKQIKWDERPPSYLGTYHAVIIDFTVGGSRKILDIKDNLQLLEKTLVPGNIDQDNMIVAVVCGSKNERYWERKQDETADDDTPADKPKPKFSYDFLGHIVPDYDLRIQPVDEESGFEPLSIKYISIRQYLDLAENYFLVFRYNADSKACSDIFPLAKTKRTSNACVAFEHRIGKGVLIVLPGYQLDRVDEARQCLLRVCRNYFKIREDCAEFELDLLGQPVPQKIRDSYNESLLCYLNDLYCSSCVSSGKALETTLELLGVEGKRFHDKIEKLAESNILYPKTVQLMRSVKVLRNAAAHPNLAKAFLTDETLAIDEEAARNTLLFLRHVLDDVLPIDKTVALIKRVHLGFQWVLR